MAKNHPYVGPGIYKEKILSGRQPIADCILNVQTTHAGFLISGYDEPLCPEWSTLSPEASAGRKGAVRDGTISTTGSGSAGGVTSKRYVLLRLIGICSDNFH